jgi:phage tail protein X
MARYQQIPTVRNIDSKQQLGKRRYINIKYPQIPLSAEDTYVYGEQGDRFDILAQQYYGDASLWWVISSANGNLSQDSYYLPLTQQIRIPANVGAIVAQYNSINGG